MDTTGVVRAAVVLCLAAAGFGCSSAASGTRAPNTFRSPTYGYSIGLPADWSALSATEVLEPGQPPLTGPPITDVMAKRPDRTVHRMDLPAVVVGAQAVADGTSIDEWTATVIDIVAGQKHCDVPTTTERLTIGGDAAVLLAYPDCPTGAHLNHLWAAVVHGNRGYHFVFFDAAGHEAADRAVLGRMLATVVFDR